MYSAILMSSRWEVRTMRPFHVALLVTLALLAVPSRADATVLTFNYVFEYSGAVPPAGPGLWLTATFDDGGTAGSVQLTLDTGGLTDNEFIDAFDGDKVSWLFNFNPDKPLDDLVITYDSGHQADYVAQLANGLKAAGNKHFDIGFGWKNPLMYKDEVVVYDFAGIVDLVAGDFDFQEVDDPPSGLKTVVHVQGIGPTDDGSGWVTNPEPSSIIIWSLIGLSFVGAGWWRRRKAR